MKPKKLIETLMKKNILSEGLTEIPSSGASEEDILTVEKRLEITINNEYKEFLKLWNGANLDIIYPYSTNKLYIENGNLA